MAKYKKNDLTSEDYSKYGNEMDRAVMSDDDYAKSVAARKEYMEYEENATNRAENGDAILTDTEKAAREALHSQIEGVRSNYDYSGGRSGDQYIELERQPQQTQQPQARQQSVQQVRQETPSYVTDQQHLVNQAQNNLMNQGAFTYNDAYAGQLQNVADRMANYGPYQYQDQFKDQMLGAANAAANYGTFRYDPYEEQYRDAIDRNALAAENYAPFRTSREAPQFADQYAGARNELLDRIMNEEKFTFDPRSDPTYQAYRQAYLREGARNRADTLGQAAALTGGGLSTAALAASQQAGDYYNTQLTDKIPELQQQAYNQYLDQIMNNRQNLSAVMGLSDQERGWYESDLGQWNTDRDFEYQNYRDNKDDLYRNVDMYSGLEKDAYGRYSGDRDFARDVWQGNVDKLRGDVDMYSGLEQDAYERGRQSWADQYNAMSDTFDRLAGRSDADRNFALDVYNNETNRLTGNVNAARGVLGDYNSIATGDRSYAYQTQRDAVADQQWADQMAQEQAQFEREMAYKENGGAVGARRSLVNDGTGNGGTGSGSTEGSIAGNTPGGGMDSKSYDVASSQIADYMRRGDKDRALHTIERAWDQMSDEQRAEIQKMLAEYGLTYEG